MQIKRISKTLDMKPTLLVLAAGMGSRYGGNKQLDEVKKEIAELKKLMETEKRDAAAIKKQMEHINKKIQDLSTEMYRKVAEEQARKQGGQGPGAAPETEGESPDEGGSAGDDVVDAEFEEVKDEDNKKKKK